MAERDVIRDVLDNQLTDKNGRNMGKVDGIIMELRGDKPPRLAYLEVGGSTFARRIHPKLGDLVDAIERRFGEAAQPYRIPWSKIRDIGIDVEVDLDAEKTSILAFEKWLSEHIIGRIPGGS